MHGRSLRTEYRVASSVKATFYFRAETARAKEALLGGADDFCTLAKGASLQHLAAADETPAGCCVKVVSDQLAVLVDLRGVIDADTELARLGKEVERITPQIEQYKRKIGVADYESKVPESVRAVNAEKLLAYETELAVTRAAMENFRKMKDAASN